MFYYRSIINYIFLFIYTFAYQLRGGLKALSGPSTVRSSVRKVRMSLLPPELFKISYPGPVTFYRLAKLVSACWDERRIKTVMVIRIILS